MRGSGCALSRYHLVASCWFPRVAAHRMEYPLRTPCTDQMGRSVLDCCYVKRPVNLGQGLSGKARTGRWPA